MHVRYCLPVLPGRFENRLDAFEVAERIAERQKWPFMPYAAQQGFIMMIEGLSVFRDQPFKKEWLSSASSLGART